MIVTEHVQVWLALVDAGRLDDDVRASLDADLDDATRTKLARFRREEDQDRGRAAHAVLRRLIGPPLGVRPRELVLGTWCRACGSREHGKPFVDGFGPVPPVEFNLSHSGGLVAVALAPAGTDVGADVESRGRKVDWTALRRSIFADAEWDATTVCSDPGHARTSMWSRKESAVKATGHGLATPLRSVLIDVHPDEIDFQTDDQTGRLARWTATIPPRTDADGEHQRADLIGWDVAAAGDVDTGYAATVAIRADRDANRAPDTPQVRHATL